MEVLWTTTINRSFSALLLLKKGSLTKKVMCSQNVVLIEKGFIFDDSLAAVKNILNITYNYVLPTTWSYTKMNQPKIFSAILAA